MPRSAKAQELADLIASIPGFISGTTHDEYGVGVRFWSELVRFLFDKIHTAYTIKSEGGTDELGNSWPPLAESTKQSKSLRSKSLRKSVLGSGGLSPRRNLTRGGLSVSQDSRWRKYFVQAMMMLASRTDINNAKKIAARIAWSKLKEEGALTIKEMRSNYQGGIMRETDRLILSFVPSSIHGGEYVPSKDQFVNIRGNRLELGTKVPYAKFHNNTRPTIPEDIDPWIQEGSKRAMVIAIQHLKENFQ